MDFFAISFVVDMMRYIDHLFAYIMERILVVFNS